MSDREWLAWRREGWGASDIAAAWTGRYGGAYRVVASKAGHDVGDDPDPDRLARGKDLEPTLGTMVQLATGWHVRGEQTWCQHPDEPTHRATVDGFALEYADDPLAKAIAVVELKTHGVEVRPAWDYYDAQTQWQMHVTGFEHAVLAVAGVDDLTSRIVSFRLQVIDADPLMQASLVALSDQLGEHLAKGTLPTPDGSDLATAAVKAVTWTDDPDSLAVDLSDIEGEVARLGAVREAMAAAKTELATIENLIRDRVGLGSRGVAGEWVVTYSKPRRVLNEERVLEDHPELGKAVLDRPAADDALGKQLDDYREPLGARTLTVRRAKEKP